MGGSLSELFDIKRGMRQGDPLSPFIFNLSIEPLAQMIRNSLQVSPSTSHSVSLYADDTLVYLVNVPATLPYVLKILEKFGYL